VPPRHWPFTCRALGVAVGIGAQRSWATHGKMMMLQPWEHLQIGDLPFSQHRETADVAAKNMGKTCGCVKKSECYS
jgi:hypothetical protein